VLQMELSKLEKDLLKKIADIESTPIGAFNIRENVISLCIFSNTLIRLLKLHKSIPASGSSNIVNLDFFASSIAISILLMKLYC